VNNDVTAIHNPTAPDKGKPHALAQKGVALCRDAALAYAARGRPVFPVPIGTKKSHSSIKQNGARWGATVDPKLIVAYWRWWPNANIGIPTGVETGFIVLEADTPEGHDSDGLASLRALEAKYGELPVTLAVISPTGSLHYYFLHPGTDIKIKNSASVLAAGVDVRGDGGMVLVPPSIRNLQDRRQYRVLDRNPIAPMPAWLIGVTKERPPPPRPQPIVCPASHGYGARALEYEIADLIRTPDGSRNAALNCASFKLHQLVASGHLDADEVRRRLIEAATANGSMDDRGNGGMRQVIATIESGARAGRLHPRGPRQ
jgi:putative DNA primase/helicase